MSSAINQQDTLLRVEHLCQYFGPTKAVDDVSFDIKRGEVFGLVGESGGGKTTTGRTIINLYDPTEGDVYFEGLRVSSTQNGLPVLLYQLRKEHKEQLAKMDERLKEDVRKVGGCRKCNIKVMDVINLFGRLNHISNTEAIRELGAKL